MTDYTKTNNVKIICCCNRSILHKPAEIGIKKSEGVDFNHVAILDEDHFVYESVWPKSRRIEYGKWINLFRIVRIYEIQLSANDYHDFIFECKYNLGIKYSVFQCILIWIINSYRGLVQKIIESIQWNGRTAMICSEMVARPLSKVLKYDFKMDLDVVGLDEIENACVNLINKQHT